MVTLDSLLRLVHLVGVALGVGAATVKLVLGLRARNDPALLPAFLAVRKPVTRILISGLGLAVISGGVWLVRGYPFSPLLVAKLVVVAAIFALGPVIDNVFEPRLETASAGTPQLAAAQRSHLTIETVATLLMYAALVLGASL